MKPETRKTIVRIVIILTILVVCGIAAYFANRVIQGVLNPFRQASSAMSTQVSELLHPTPTILPNPVTIIHEVRSLARLETIRYSVEKIVSGEVNQGLFGPLFGDKMLFVAHGLVVAGIDMEKLGAEDMWLEDSILHVRLPKTEVFIATLDNEKSYVYDRETGLFTHGNVNLETSVRQAAETEILKAAIEDDILVTAEQYAESYLTRLFLAMGYPEVIFVGGQ